MAKDEKQLDQQEEQNPELQEIVTNSVLEVLRSLNVIDETGNPIKQVVQDNTPKKKLFGTDYKPHVASQFGTSSDYGAEMDDLLSQSSMLPIHQVEGARRSFAGMQTPGVSKGPMDMERMRTAAGDTGSGFGRGTSSFSGLQMDPLIGNSFSMLNFSLSRSNPYMVNRMYGSGMYGDIPVYFMMMQEQNGGLLYWPVSIREKYQWYRYFYRCIFVSDNDLGQISMSDGTQKDIRKVEVGEEIITALGTKKKVKEIFERECHEKKAVTVKCHNLQLPIKTTHHHPFYALRNACVEYSDGKKAKEVEFEPKWIHAENLEVGDYLLLPGLKSEEHSNLSSEEARLLGYYAAEGHIIYEKRCVGTDENGKGYKWNQEKIKVPVAVGFTLAAEEKDTIVAEIQKICKDKFGIEPKIVRERNNAIELLASGRELAEFCFYHVGSGSHDKKLSEELMNAELESKLQFLTGYAEGDGCLYQKDNNSGKIVITTTSRNLASQTQLMFISCGVMCRYAIYNKNDKGSGYEGSVDYQIHITIPSWCSNEICKRSITYKEHDGSGRKRGAIITNGYAAFKIKEITYSEEKGMVYNLCIDAEGDESSFICNGVANHNTDPYVGSIIDLHTDLPVSRIGFTMPKLKNDPDGSKARSCLKRCQKWGEAVGLYERIMEGIFEWTLIGNNFTFCEWDDQNKWWSKLTVLPPEEVGIVHFPFSDFAFAEYRPEPLIKLVAAVATGQNTDSSQDVTPLEKAIYDNIPNDIVNSIRQFGSIIMDTDPTTGSFVAHLARKRSPYADLGVSTLERCIIPLLQKEHFKYTQLSLSSRLMTPRNKITAPGISPDATDNLRSEIDLSMEDPDYHVVTNFDFGWDLIGAENRLIQLQPEYERIENEIFAALGATKELITGEASYGGAKITAEILNTRYLLVRDVFKNFVEKKLLLTMAMKNGWHEVNDDGENEYYYPMLTFNRLTIRDNQEMFDALFQLYQKGSVPVQVIYELFNLNPDEMNDVLVDDMFTVRDATFNEMLRQVHTDLGTKMVDETDIFDRVAKYCGLTTKTEEGELKTTPVTDIGDAIFSAPEEESSEEETAPEEGSTEEDNTEEDSTEEAGGGLEEALAEIGGGAEEGGGEEEAPAEEEVIEE